MKRTKNESENEKEPPKKKNSDFGHEIWGIIYLAIAVLVLIALISHFFNNTTNILGSYLGTGLAAGLIFLTGTIPSFFFPAATGYIGWTRLKGDQITVRNLMLSLLLTLELCILLAIHRLPGIAENSLQTIDANWIGTSIIKLVQPVFGSHMFGPYFIVCIMFIITVFITLRVSPKMVFALLAAFGKWFAISLPKLFNSFFDKSAPVSHQKTAATTDTPAAPSPRSPQTTEAPSSKKIQTPDGTHPIDPKIPAAKATDKLLDPAEEEQRRQMEDELAAFRAKRRAPIQIMTVETSDVDAEEPQLDETELRHAVEAGDSNDDPSAPAAQTSPGRRPAASSDLVSAEEEIIAMEPQEPIKPYEIPDLSILTDPPALMSMIDKVAIERNSATLEKTLLNFGVEGKVVAVSPGPVVTRYEIVLAPGIKISKVVNLHNDISLAVGGQPIRIEAPIPGKSAVGIELPNAERQIVYFKHVLASDAFAKTKAKLPVVVGTNISGAPYVADIFKMPHMLIAGQTGSGKSVCINSIICSLLMTKKPDELRLIMIDPKKVELSFYEGIPHLLAPVVTESKEAVKALHWGVNEMERRYRLLAKVGARNIDSFNGKIESGKLADILPPVDNNLLPFIVILVDELADLMTKASKDVEILIQRIAQLARAVGIHLIVATQRPSVDIITGPIKANLTSRVAFRTIQSTDSRTILDHIGAEKLLGMGDMLFLRNGAPQIERFHGAFISEEDVDKIVAAVRVQKVNVEKIESFSAIMGGDDEEEESGESGLFEGKRDEHFEEAARMIASTGLGSTSLLQRRLNLGYARAGRIMDQLHDAGIVGPPNGSKAREVMISPAEVDEVLASLYRLE